ncbi:MAG: hypothetical protein NTZ79_17450 [Proteobacteria bacterium]|nr:hypothetical protein [Pseudomonadota bacterium]
MGRVHQHGRDEALAAVHDAMAAGSDIGNADALLRQRRENFRQRRRVPSRGRQLAAGTPHPALATEKKPGLCTYPLNLAVPDTSEPLEHCKLQ